MRVSLFGLFLRCTSLMEPWPKLVQSVLLVIRFYIGFPDDYAIPVHTCYTCILTLLSTVLDIVVIYTLMLILARHLAFASPLAWGVLSDSPGSSCPGHGAWSVWILSVADQSGATVAWISSRPSASLSFQAPACLPSFPVVTRERHLYCSYL